MPDIIYSRYNKKPARSVELPDTWIKCSYTRTDTNGTYTYDEVGRTDMSALIQSYAPTCDIKLLISRYLNGDVAALGRQRNNFTVTPDMSNVPTHMIGRVLLSNIPSDFGKVAQSDDKQHSQVNIQPAQPEVKQHSQVSVQPAQPEVKQHSQPSVQLE